MLKRILSVAFMLVAVVMLAACGGTGDQPAAPVPTQATGQQNATPTAGLAGSASQTIVAGLSDASPQAPAAGAASGQGRMTIDTAKGQIVLELYTDPSSGVIKTLINFAKKANSGFFDGLTFHRVEDWVIQGGDPAGTGSGGGTMPAEYNSIPFTAGSLGVARGGDPANNSDCQFFIVKTDSFHLNGQYTNWGKVVQGMDVVNKIAAGDKITKIRIDGVDVNQTPPPVTEHITVQHILIGFKDAVGFQGQPPAKAATRTQDQAKALAYDLFNQIKAGADFDKLVTQYTDDSPPGIYKMSNYGVTPDQANQEYSRSNMVPAFGNVGFGLQVGQVGIADYDPQTSPFGYHIIKRLK